jgi:hypothetical protein
MKRKELQRVTPRELCRHNVCGVKKVSEAVKLLQAAIDRGLGLEEGNSRPHSRRGPEVQSFVLRRGEP